MANTTIVRRDKTLAERLGSLDERILAKMKELLGDAYYPLVYVFWCFIIFIAILVIFKFAFMFSSPGENDGENGGSGGVSVPLLGIVIMALLVIFAIYYYFSYIFYYFYITLNYYLFI